MKEYKTFHGVDYSNKEFDSSVVQFEIDEKGELKCRLKNSLGVWVSVKPLQMLDCINHKFDNITPGDIRKMVQSRLDDMFISTLPYAIIRDDNGKLTKDYSPRDWDLKLREKIFEVMKAIEGNGSNKGGNVVAEKITDVITVCISWLNALGYEAKERSNLFADMNEKNHKKGYFKGKDLVWE